MEKMLIKKILDFIVGAYRSCNCGSLFTKKGSRASLEGGIMAFRGINRGMEDVAKFFEIHATPCRAARFHW
jgi:hypothetical protein